MKAPSAHVPMYVVVPADLGLGVAGDATGRLAQAAAS